MAAGRKNFIFFLCLLDGVQFSFDCWYCVQVFLLNDCEVTWVDTPANK